MDLRSFALAGARLMLQDILTTFPELRTELPIARPKPAGKAAALPGQKSCPACGLPFTPARSDSTFCQRPACKRARHNAESRASRAKRAGKPKAAGPLLLQVVHGNGGTVKTKPGPVIDVTT